MTMHEQIADSQRMMKVAAERNPSSLEDFIAGLDPETVRTLRNALIGSALGGAAGASAGAISPDRSTLGSGILGAVLGGVAGGAGTLGYDLIRGNRMFGIEEDPGNIVDRWMVDPVAGAVIANPAATVGGAAGGVWALARRPRLNDVLAAATEADLDLARLGSSRIPRPPGTPPPPSPTNLSTLAPMVSRVRAQPLNLEALRALHGAVSERGLYGRGVRSPWNLAAIPAGAALGWLIDRYLQGRNR